jgi:site-specific recombinase XerD
MEPTTHFTKAFLDNLPTPEPGKRFIYHDAKATGLQLRITSTGVKTFSLYRRVKGGNPERITLGRYPDMTIEQARKQAAQYNLMIESGANPAHSRRKARLEADGELTLRQAFDRYVADYLVPHGKRTVAALQENFARYLGEVPDGTTKPRGKVRSKPACAVNWEKRKLSSIEAGEVRRLMNALKDGIGVHTANRTMELLRAVYNKVIAWKLYTGENPCHGLEKFKMKSRERFLTGEELPHFFQALSQTENKDFRDFVLLSLTTGARKANVLAMKWGDIDFDNLIWTVPGEFSKNGDPLTLPLTSAAAEVLDERKGQGSEWVFPAARSASGHMENPKKHWAALLQSAGLENLRLHDLRRSLGSWAAMSGASLAIIGRALGHKSVDATQIYARLQVDPVRAAMELATSQMLGRAGYKSKATVVKLEKNS